jgi:hypothetical protein
MYDAYKAHQTYKFTPKPEQWRRYARLLAAAAAIATDSLNALCVLHATES